METPSSTGRTRRASFRSSDWPLFAPRRAAWRAKIGDGSIPGSVFKEVRARLSDGPATANDLGGAKAGGPWWDWTDTKRAVERMLGAGEVVCMERRGFQRVYDLADRRVPDTLLRYRAQHLGMSPSTCLRGRAPPGGRDGA